MEEILYWRLCDQLSVKEAALLMIGIDPSGEVGSSCEICTIEKRPKGYEATKNGIASALRREIVSGQVVPEEYYNSEVDAFIAIENSIDPCRSSVDVDSLRNWLESRGIRTGFFFPSATGSPDYLDPKNPRYAPKLAAAVRVWQAMGDENLLRGKSPVQAMEAWLESRYKELGLAHERNNERNGTKAGDMNNSAISEVAKVANWQLSGGAPKTP